MWVLSRHDVFCQCFMNKLPCLSVFSHVNLHPNLVMNNLYHPNTKNATYINLFRSMSLKVQLHKRVYTIFYIILYFIVYHTALPVYMLGGLHVTYNMIWIVFFFQFTFLGFEFFEVLKKIWNFNFSLIIKSVFFDIFEKSKKNTFLDVVEHTFIFRMIPLL